MDHRRDNYENKNEYRGWPDGLRVCSVHDLGQLLRQSNLQKQIAGKENAYIAADNIEYALGNKIPLWLFGFLY